MSDYYDQILKQAKQASLDMAKLTANDRSKILMNISEFLIARKHACEQLKIQRCSLKSCCDHWLLILPYLKKLALLVLEFDHSNHSSRGHHVILMNNFIFTHKT